MQVTEIAPIVSTFEPLSVLTLPNATSLVETVQFSVTVAVTLSVELAVWAVATPGTPIAAQANSAIPAVRTAARLMLDMYNSFWSESSRRNSPPAAGDEPLTKGSARDAVNDGAGLKSN